MVLQYGFYYFPSLIMEPKFESRVIESFSKYVNSYERNAQLQKSMAERLASLLPNPLPSKILELGCGTGIFTRHILAKGAKKLVINDIAPAMIEYIKSHLDFSVNVSFQVGNAEFLKFSHFDLISGNAVFQWFQNPETTLKNLGKALNKNGSLIFSTFGPRTLKEFRETAGLQGPTRLLSQNKWEELLKAANLDLKDFEIENREIFFSGTRQLLKNLQQIGAAPLKKYGPGGLRTVISQYDQNFSSPQGVYTHWELFFLRAQKKTLTLS